MTGTTNYSIIIPHYNIPDYLKRCLRSIPLREDTEVIVVDDCSDGFETFKAQLLEEFTGLRLAFYSTARNSGPGIARNVGIEKASGKWILFIDADDFFTDDCSEILDEYADSCADMIMCHLQAVKNSDISEKSDEYTYEDCYHEYEKNGEEKWLRYFMYSVTGRLIQRKLLNDNQIRFGDRYCGEDMLFSICLGYFAKEIKVSEKYLCIFTEREGSLSRSWANWSQWYEQFFPAHIEGMRFLNERRIHAIDLAVANKMAFLRRCDKICFQKYWKMFYRNEKVRYYWLRLRNIPAGLQRRIKRLIEG